MDKEKMYGVKFKGVPHFHLNSANVFTSLRLPNSGGDWQVFSSPKEAIKEGNKLKPHCNRELEVVELS